MIPDLTVVIGVDEKTLQQWIISAPTWKQNRPELWDLPWIIFYDRDSVNLNNLLHVVTEFELEGNSTLCKWPFCSSVRYENQRAKMLSGFCHIPMHVKTTWWLKIDTDVLVTEHCDWTKDEWFDEQNGEYNAWISSPWGYTVGPTMPAQLDAWGNQVPGLKLFPELDIEHDPTARVVKHPRMASWVSFYNTRWTQLCCEYLHETGHVVGTLPVPSQDTFHWYVSERRGDRTCRFPMKTMGWKTCSSTRKLKEMAQEILHV